MPLAALAVGVLGGIAQYADSNPYSVHVYRSGELIVEGAEKALDGRNDGRGRSVLMESSVTPYEKPLS